MLPQDHTQSEFCSCGEATQASPPAQALLVVVKARPETQRAGCYERSSQWHGRAGDAHLRRNMIPRSTTILDFSWLESMDPLPKEFAPSEPAWSNSVAVCAVMKDEAVADIIEWLGYYRCASRTYGLQKMTHVTTRHDAPTNLKLI